jgi:hypothetical protein
LPGTYAFSLRRKRNRPREQAKRRNGNYQENRYNDQEERQDNLTRFDQQSNEPRVQQDDLTSRDGFGEEQGRAYSKGQH